MFPGDQLRLRSVYINITIIIIIIRAGEGGDCSQTAELKGETDYRLTILKE